jgi:pimeloyl-ACP methyl ester carboxylesterase
MDTRHLVRTVRANGLDFACIEAGEGPLVLMLHGFPDSAWSFQPLLQPLAEKGFRACAVFMRGYAPSPLTRDYRMLRLGEDAIALIESLGEERAVLVGHDWGAVAAYVASGMAPERVSHLVTAAVPHLRRFFLRPTRRQLLRSRYMARFQLPGAVSRFATGDALDRLIREWSPDWAFTAADLAPVREMLADPQRAAALIGYYRHIPRSLSDPALWRFAMAPIKVPTTMIAGLNDGCIGPEMFADQEHLFTRGLRLQLFEDAGHFMHCERPQRFANTLMEAARTA